MSCSSLLSAALGLFLQFAVSQSAHAQLPPAPAAQRVAALHDTVSLTLSQAVARGISEGQEVRLAQTQVATARQQTRLIKSEALPQLSANLGYTRTFASAFSSGGGFTLPDSLKFSPDSTASLEERIRYLEQNAPNAGLGGLGSLFGNLPFGQKNAYTATLNGSQPLFSGGKLGAGIKIAHELEETAKLGVVAQTAEVEMEIRSAYVRAQLSQQLVAISQEAVAQAERFLSTARLRLSAGQASELEVLRAEVSVANLRPQAVQATNASELALLDLKRLINMPIDQPIRLETPMDAPTPASVDPRDEQARLLANRSEILAAERQVRISELQVKVARADYFPSLKLNFAYVKQLFPSGVFALDEPWRTDATAGLTLAVPLFNGNRTSANVETARIAVQQDRLRLGQLREAVQLEYERARGERSRALASIQSTQLTVSQAQRVYDLTVLRYEQGLASQLEVTDARLALLQARTNLAQAIADYNIAAASVTRALGGTTVSAPGR
jgi:outer membrane protein TolC